MGEFRNLTDDSDSEIIVSSGPLRGYSKPTGLVATNITQSSFIVSWNTNSNVVNYEITYRPVSVQTYSAASTTTGSFWFTNLDRDAAYEVMITAVYNGNIRVNSEFLEVKTLP